jgi:hypothetical protein
MDETRNPERSSEEAKPPNPRDAQGFKENPAPQGLKTPPPIERDEDSGEWTRGGGSNPNEVREGSTQAFNDVDTGHLRMIRRDLISVWSRSPRRVK